MYEAAPLAYLAEQAGGYGSDGQQSLLEIVPTHIHQRVPVFIGNRFLVEQAQTFLSTRE
jgi:fructose-1,6-bisphosphatase I